MKNHNTLPKPKILKVAVIALTGSLSLFGCSAERSEPTTKKDTLARDYEDQFGFKDRHNNGMTTGNDSACLALTPWASENVVVYSADGEIIVNPLTQGPDSLVFNKQDGKLVPADSYTEAVVDQNDC